MEELFKSLSESVSEECFEDILGIIEEYINELKDSTIGLVHNKRLENYKSALNNAIKNPSSANIANYKRTSNKLANNSRLSYNAFTRSGNIKNANVVSPEKKQQTSNAYKSNYIKAKTSADNAVNKYNSQLHNDRSVAKEVDLGTILDMHNDPKRATLKDEANKKEEIARQARKNYHNVMDYTNTVPRDDKTLRDHLEYQRTHDEKGNRK